MTRQLNLRVSDDFADKLERVAGKLGRPMAGVLEAVGAPALDAVESDAEFEAEALAAWEAYQLDGVKVSTRSIDQLFSQAASRARTASRTAQSKRR